MLSLFFTGLSIEAVFDCLQFLDLFARIFYLALRWVFFVVIVGVHFLDYQSLPIETYFLCTPLFLESTVAEPETRTKEEMLTHLDLVHLTTFLFIKHFVCVTSTNVTFLPIVKI